VFYENLKFPSVSGTMYDIPYVPELSSQEEKQFFFILRKNFRGITFFASFETTISVIKISILIYCILKLTFSVKIWTLEFNFVINFITIGLVF
jgi:hypothetical protein